jgi:hypothetical protein
VLGGGLNTRFGGTIIMDPLPCISGPSPGCLIKPARFCRFKGVSTSPGKFGNSMAMHWCDFLDLGGVGVGGGGFRCFFFNANLFCVACSAKARHNSRN